MNTQALIRIFGIILFLTSYTSKAQLSDDFSDGNHTHDPAWEGNPELFRVNEAYQLQLNDTIANTASLYLPNAMIAQTEWRFFIHIDFNPSSASWVKVYLASDSDNFMEELNGYYLQFGETGSTDAITLLRQQGEVIDTVARGSQGLIAEDFAMHLKVTRDDSGNWSIFTDTEGNGIWEFEAAGFDNAIDQTHYFGFLCKYAKSYSKRIYFDDFYVGDIEQDITPPYLESLNVKDDHSIELKFSEALSRNTAENAFNYFVDQGIGHPTSVVLDDDDLSLIHLIFPVAFPSRQLLTLRIEKLKDLAGNEMEPIEKSFSWFVANEFDILINEIMADPSPPVGLPEAEYIELYNPSAFPVNLTNWILVFGNQAKTFPEISLPADSFLIITKGNDMDPYGLTIDLFTNEYSLTNNGSVLTLMSSDSSIIHSVAYTLDYYHDPGKDGGGWALEMRDPENPCGNADNWYASQDIQGGTPGGKNSVYERGFNIPKLNKAIAFGGDTIKVVFNQRMKADILNTAAYEITKGIGKPIEALFADTLHHSVFLVLSGELQAQVSYELVIKDTLRNCSGNYVTLGSSLTFHVAVPPERFDVVINEIMADPSPAVELPEHEYIELYNGTDFPIFIENWVLQIGDEKEILPDATIPALGYLLISDVNAYADLRDYGNFVGISGFSLSNEGTGILLRSSDGNLVHALEYDISWYADDYKEEGGYSLEQIDPENPCGGNSNWIASQSIAGGTPGKVNSVKGKNPDHSSPYLLRAFAADPFTIIVRFSEPMDSISLVDPDRYHINNGIGNPVQVEVTSLPAKSVKVKLSHSLAPQLIYRIRITGNCTDCIGNPVDEEKTIRVALPKKAGINDLVINEILFNPPDNGVDFVEIYNVSDKVIDMQKLLLTGMDTIEEYLHSINDISKEGFLIFPEDHLVLTTAPEKVKSFYFTRNPDHFIRLSSMPQFGNSNGIAVIADKSYAVIDRFAYDESMHFPLLNDTEGVSLERINPERPSGDRSNWHSASETAGFATPAYQNSQFMAIGTYKDNITIDPEIFSPDNDGYQDILTISYTFDQPGFTANVRIYDTQGRLIRYLLKNELMGTSGSFMWDGINEDREKAAIGIYILYIEVFNMEGKVDKFKKTAVLAGKMK